MSLRIEALSHRTPVGRVLDRVSLEAAPGECLALLGPPGSGRAALLRVLAGLEEAEGGRVLLEGRDITCLPPSRRGIGFLFRQDMVFGHPTVFDAVAAALPEGPGGPEETAFRVRHLLDLTGLGQDGGWMPAMLPPSRRHRLALARALAAGPRLLLVAAGFGSRTRPRRWLKEAQRRLGLTMLLVATGPEEAMALGDRVAVMQAGRIEQVAPPEGLRRRPASAFVARVLGAAPAFPGPDGPAAAPGPLLPASALEVVEAGTGTPARVLSAIPFGGTLRLEVQLLADGSRLEAEAPAAAAPLPPGSIVGLRLRRAGSGSPAS
jgi:ABC-type sulfate/molybdate transport systems ATPase subunit